MSELTLKDFPETTNLQRVRFESGIPPQQNALLIPGRDHVVASIERDVFPGQAPGGHELLILSVPSLPSQTDSAELLTLARQWVEQDTATTERSACSSSKIVILHGTQIVFQQGRMAILADESRLEQTRRILIEAAYFESELRGLESTVQQAWTQLESDIPASSQFNDESIPQLTGLRKRTIDVWMLRARAARLAEQVHTPHVHPPTHASQLAERFRERLQMAHRHEILDQQLEVFERVYEAVSQRSNDFLLNRSNLTLEWIIIVLLIAQLILAGFEILTRTGT